MEKILCTKTQEWIINALLYLMDEKDFQEITIVEIVSKAHIGRRTFYRYFKHKDDVLLLYCNIIIQDFAEIILSKGEMTLYSVALSYFEFWERHLNFLQLLNKSHMLSFIWEQMPELLTKVALMTNHVSLEQITLTEARKDTYYYAFYFNLGGFFSVTTTWLKKKTKETPKEMAKLMVEIILRKI